MLLNTMGINHAIGYNFAVIQKMIPVDQDINSYNGA